MFYRRQPRTLLEMTREAWEKTPNKSTDLLDYNQHLKTRLSKLRDLAVINLEKAQTKQKKPIR